MKKLHETEPPKKQNKDDSKTYTPFEELQKIEGGPLKLEYINSTGMPKGIRIIGYFIAGVMVLFILAAVIFSFI
ncbi:hypothetical protein [Falsibacillus albus]|uniref:Uncharacterized protein n=1 Tax=Falsibacillus albus TaxID=2478915 RepID=A0A3L7JTZ3_9BACI|nr:hypothetical protein [Falsibacillus albus]RLQ94357.1 hypothetical protein D9X91_15000 [Falsibacillus albus]